MRIGIIGCGFVADYYMQTLSNYPNLKLVGVMDQNKDRAAHFTDFYGIKHFPSIEALIEKAEVTLILNLTNPRNHFEVSKTCLNAGVHVYSEKPLATNFAEAEDLVKLAEEKGLAIAGAPCNILSETAQTLWKAIRENVIGPIRLVYGEMDDGTLHKMAYRKWFSSSGVPWPYKDEFEVGCTLEHAGYYIGWLVAFFGAAETVTAFSACLIPEKVANEILTPSDTPDFSVACIRFSSGVVARLTCGIVAPHNHGLKIVGEEGILCTDDCWNYKSPVYVRKRITIRRKTLISPLKNKVPLLKAPGGKIKQRGSQQMDFVRGVGEMASAIQENRLSRLPSDFILHVNEIVLAIQNIHEYGGTYKVQTRFKPLTPMPWA